MTASGLVVAILRPGARESEQREMPKEPHLIQRVFRRLTREGAVAACYEAGALGVRPLPADHGVGSVKNTLDGRSLFVAARLDAARLTAVRP